MSKTFMFLYLLCLACSISFGQDPRWHQKLKQIVPSVSKKVDVERTFKDAKLDKTWINNGVEARYYRTGDGRLSVYFAESVCTIGDGKTIDKGTVIDATFFPVEKVSLRKFKVSKKDFSETMENDNPTTHFISSTLGLDYSTQRGRVINVTIFPRGFSSDSFKCT